jgi:hypothetical protein
MTSHQCRLKAEEIEQLARIVSFRRDREEMLEQARTWRVREASAKADEDRRAP